MVRSPADVSFLLTSITLSPSCSCAVIDFCLVKEMVCDHGTNFQSLRLNWASRSSLVQRQGRAGRVRDGKCYRLITRDFYCNQTQQYSIPEMQVGGDGSGCGCGQNVISTCAPHTHTHTHTHMNVPTYTSVLLWRVSFSTSRSLISESLVLFCHWLCSHPTCLTYSGLLST